MQNESIYPSPFHFAAPHLHGHDQLENAFPICARQDSCYYFLMRFLILEALNMSDAEKAVIAVIDRQKMARNVSQIAKDADVPRTTAIYILKKFLIVPILHQKGLCGSLIPNEVPPPLRSDYSVCPSGFHYSPAENRCPGRRCVRG